MKENLLDSIDYNILEVNKIKTNKLDYSNKKNIIYINNENSKHLLLNSTNTNSILVTENNNMDIHIYLSSIVVGTIYKLLITNKQNSLKIECIRNTDKLIGQYKLSQNSHIENNISINNILKKRRLLKSNINGNDIFNIIDCNLTC